MKIKLGIFVLILLSLTGCSSGMESTVLDSPAISVDSDIAELFNNTTVTKEVIDLPSGDCLSVIIPDGYTKLEMNPDLPEVKLAYTSDINAFDSNNAYVLVQWLLIDTDDIGEYSINPLMKPLLIAAPDKRELIEKILPEPIVSDACTYLTGDITCAGFSIRNSLDLSALNVTYPKYSIPEVNYLFALDVSNSLLLRVSYNADHLPELVNEASNAVLSDNYLPSSDISADEFQQIDVLLEEISLDICKHALYFDR